MRVRLHSVFALIAALSFSVAAGGCGHSKAAATAANEAEKPKPKNAHTIALQVVQGKVGTMIEVDRVRDRPAATKLLHAGLAGDALEGTGIDLLRDAKRVFIASTGIKRTDAAVAVVWHRLSEDNVRLALDVLVRQGNPPGAWIDDAGIPAARVTVRGHTRVIGMIAPEYVAIVPVSLAKELRRFAGTGGLPEPEGTESAVTTAEEPATSLRAPRMPHVPATIKLARLRVTLGLDGSADLAGDGECATAEQAVADAKAMAEEVENATTVRVSILRVRVFKPIPFRAEGTHVKSDLHLSPEEIDKLIGMAQLVGGQL